MQRASNSQIPDHHEDLDLRDSAFFRRLMAFEFDLRGAVKVTRTYQKGATLFVEGQSSDTVYLLCEGSVKLSTCSRAGKVTTLRVAEPGDILGLAAGIASADHELTAEALEDCQVDLVSRSALLEYLERHPRAAWEAAVELSQRCLAARQLIGSLANSDPVFVRLARLFLGWSENGNGGRLRLETRFTHQQIAEMIGTSRETVTRAVREMRERDLVTLKGEHLVIHDRDRLKLITGARDL
jgi:CRP/FNR family transcriptional regulator